MNKYCCVNTITAELEELHIVETNENTLIVCKDCLEQYIGTANSISPLQLHNSNGESFNP